MEDQLIVRLEANLAVLNAQLNNRSKEEYFYKAEENSWSTIQVLSHLVDVEIFDFRARLFSIVENPSRDLPLFDPLKAMANKNFIDEDYNELLDQFMNERLISVAKLRTIAKSDWQKVYEHPKLGPLTPRFFLTNWVAHDYIHIQQINRLAYQFLKSSTIEMLDYAGTFRLA